ncbi:DUF6843 domain-containing protein [Bacillus pacificus]
MVKKLQDTIYLISEEYEGDLIVVYNVPGAKLLPKEEEFSIVTLQPTGLLLTSTKNMKYGTVNDLYYTVNKEGQRTKLIRAVYTLLQLEVEAKIGNSPVANLEVTRTACSQKFPANGREVTRESRTSC